jgi:rod shape-determining protein MreB
VVPGESLETTIRGRDLITGLPREVVITDSDIREAIASSIDTLVEAAKEVLETTPPEILADVMHRGVHLVGGGALIKGLDVLLSQISPDSRIHCRRSAHGDRPRHRNYS